VWSVWSKRTQLYISATFSMVKAPGQALLRVTYPSTLTLDRLLLRITEAINDNAATGISTSLKRARLVVTLGGSICPPLEWQVPSGINNWKELALLAHHSAAQQLTLSASDLVCTWSPATPSVLCALPRWSVQSMHEWAGHNHATVTSIRPLWAVASNCGLARTTAIKGLCVYEDNGVVSLTNPHIPVDDASILKMRFNQEPLPKPIVFKRGPSDWRQHWQAA
jgi:hypothetical protein